MLNFEQLRKSIKQCKKCKMKNRHSPPLFFECNDPKKVKILVISEQPMETNNSITEEKVKNNLIGKEDASKTIRAISNLFSEHYKDSIINDGGYYYWTHHTKCPSSKNKSTKKKCPKKWLGQEVEVFRDLKCIFCIGSKAHDAIMQIAEDNVESFADILWREFEIIIQNKVTENLPKIIINGKELYYIVLPHPSESNPMHVFLTKFEPVIKYLEKLILPK